MVHAAVVNNPDVIPVSEKTIYRYIDGGLLKTKNGDLPRKCKLAPRKGVEHKADAQCRINRSIEDYHKFIERNPGLPVTEMDTVEGTKGGKVLLTFMPYSFMLAFLLDSKTSANVTAVFRTIRDMLIGKFGKDAGLAIMGEMFAVILTDNGTEFSYPLAIEVDCEGNRIANLFYCDPGASYQKPHVERNHEGIRLILPKGNYYLLPTSFDDLTQEDVDIRKIPANDIVLKPKLLGIEQKVRPWVTEETNPRKVANRGK